MIKKIFYILCLFSFSFAHSSTNVFIYATIDNQIITNLDIEKESEYLKSLNKDLSQLNENSVFILAKDSLIKEIIKKNEIEKFVNLENDHTLLDEYLKNFYLKLKFNNENEFKNYLISKKHYSFDEIKQKLKIEILWNELIFTKYKNQVKIDKDFLLKKIQNKKKDTFREYFLSEIVLQKNKDESLIQLKNKIDLSINEIGFNNTANIYSISDSSKMGGNIGWVNENNLSKKINEEIVKIEENQYSDLIRVGNNYIILKIEKIRDNNIPINEEEELNKMIQYETNNQLNKFSRIFFNKLKVNYSINEK